MKRKMPVSILKSLWLSIAIVVIWPNLAMAVPSRSCAAIMAARAVMDRPFSPDHQRDLLISIRSYYLRSLDLEYASPYSYYSKAAIQIISHINFLSPQPDERSEVEDTILEDFVSPRSHAGFLKTSAITLSYDWAEVNGTRFCGECEQRFIDALLDPKPPVRSSPIPVRVFLLSLPSIGIVGAVKLSGDATLLALRDVAGPDGRPLLIRGGVYDTDGHWMHTSVQRMKIAGEPSVVVLELDSLVVSPGRFLNINSKNLADIVGVKHKEFGPRISREEYREKWYRLQEHLTEVLNRLETKALSLPPKS